MTHHPRQFNIPKPKKKPKKRRRGMARPDEPLAPYCQVGRAGVCTGRSEHRHHIRLRRQGGTDDAANTVDCCAACHGFIHANPSKAYAHGWLAHAWDAPDEVESA